MTESIEINGSRLPTSRFDQQSLALGDNGALLDESVGGQYDNISALYVLMAADARSDSSASLEDIEAANQERAEAWQEHIEALRQAREAQEDDGFWSSFSDTFGSVAAIAGVVGSVALAVGTMGAAAPVAALAIGGALLSGASMAQSEFHYLEEMGMSSETANWVGMGMGLGGAAMSLGAGGYAIFAESASVASAATTTERVANTLGQGAMVVSGASAVAAGAGTLVLAHHRSEAAHHRADAAEAYLDAQMLQFLISQLTDEFAEDAERETANVQRITQMNEITDASLTLAAGGAA